MAIIDQARGAQQQPPQTAPEQPPAAAAPQAGAQRPPPSENAKNVIVASYGMLYDKRMGLGEKLGAEIKAAKDPMAVVAASAHDVVASAIDKTGAQVPDDEFKQIVMLVLGRLLEIAEAVGVPVNPEDAARVGQILMEKMGAGEEPGEAQEMGEGPGQEEPGEPATEMEQD